MIHDIKMNLHAKTGRIIRSNINYTLIHKIFFKKLKKINLLEIGYSLVTIYKDFLDSPKKNIYMLDRKKNHLLLVYITAR